MYIYRKKRQEASTIQVPKSDVTYSIVKLGGEGLLKCFQCGSCTAICPISDELNTSFRRTIKYAQLGLRDRLLSDTTPWLCHACGECSESCPRDADPTGIMAAIRRYLITEYDWTGIAKRFAFSKKFEIASIIFLSLITLIAAWLLHGPILLDRVALETFAPLEIVETAGIAVFLVLASILLSNIYRMYRFVMRDLPNGSKLSIRDYLGALIGILPVHFFTQRLMGRCERNRGYWLIHLLIFYGYGMSFILFMILLRFTQTDEPFLFVNPLSILGITGTVALIIGASLSIYGRLKKSRPIWRSSHSTDWIFISLLLTTTVTGILVGIFRTLNLALLTYIMYVIHLMFVAPFLILEVPFAKWSHLAYRPFAIYFHELRRRVERPEEVMRLV